MSDNLRSPSANREGRLEPSELRRLADIASRLVYRMPLDELASHVILSDSQIMSLITFGMLAEAVKDTPESNKISSAQ